MQIPTFEHGCEIMGYDPTKLPIVDHLPVIHQKAQVASYKLFVISEASWKGEGKVINWNDRSQYKWDPFFYMNKPGFRLNVSVFDFAGTHSAGGSRLCYPSEEDSDFHGETHLELYRDLMVKEG